LNKKIYFDESGIFKLRTVESENGFDYNDRFGFFILGGVMYDALDEINFGDLHFSDEYKSSGEMTNFIAAIQSDEVIKKLSFLRENNIDIHFEIYDLFYHSVSKIVDENYIHMSDEYRIRYKDNLWKEFIKNDEYKTLSIFKKFKYPNFDNSQELEKRFKNQIDKFISNEQPGGIISDMNYTNIINSELSKYTNMNLISSQLFGEFWELYKSKINLYNGSCLYFDNQEQVKKKLKNHLKNNENVHFVDSKTTIEIQISDFICGLVRRFFEWINITNIDIILEEIYQLKVKKGFDLFKNLFFDTESKSYKHDGMKYSISLHTEMKMKYLIQCHFSEVIGPSLHRINKNLELFQCINSYSLEDLFLN
jgi:hypothetical protein